jgi:hypothetical protein
LVAIAIGLPDHMDPSLRFGVSEGSSKQPGVRDFRKRPSTDCWRPIATITAIPVTISPVKNVKTVGC